MTVEIRILDETDVDQYIPHLDRIMKQSGKNGNPVFNPFEIENLNPNEKHRERFIKQWQAPLEQPEWRRNWGIFLEGSMIGNLTLVGGTIHANMHRVLMMMGIEDGHKAKGLGKRILQEAISWAKENKFEWMDLGVFAHNEKAIGLYKNFGFKETGRVIDRFRVYDQKITDVSMSLDLRH